jgi:hypothetical protein
MARQTVATHLIKLNAAFGIKTDDYEKFFEARCKAIGRELAKQIIPQEITKSERPGVQRKRPLKRRSDASRGRTSMSRPPAKASTGSSSKRRPAKSKSSLLSMSRMSAWGSRVASPRFLIPRPR